MPRSGTPMHVKLMPRASAFHRLQPGRQETDACKKKQSGGFASGHEQSRVQQCGCSRHVCGVNHVNLPIMWGSTARFVVSVVNHGQTGPYAGHVSIKVALGANMPSAKCLSISAFLSVGHAVNHAKRLPVNAFGLCCARHLTYIARSSWHVCLANLLHFRSAAFATSALECLCLAGPAQHMLA